MNANQLIATFRDAILAYKKSETLFEQVDALVACDPQQSAAWAEAIKERHRIASELETFFRSYAWPTAFGGSELAWDKGLRELEHGHSLLVSLEISSGHYAGKAVRLGQPRVAGDIWAKCGQPTSVVAQSVMHTLREQIQAYWRTFVAI